MRKKKQFNTKMFLINRRHMLISIVLGLTSFSLLFFAIIPQFQEILSLNNELNEQTPKLEKLQKKLVDLENIRLTPEFAQTKIVNDALPSKKPLLELLTSLNTIAVSNSIHIEEFTLNPGLIASNAAELQNNAKKTKLSNGMDTIDVSMDVLGSFSDVQQFLIDLEKISPFTTINTLSLNSVKNGDDFGKQSPDMKASLETKSYFFTEAVSAAIEAPLPVLSVDEQRVLKELEAFSSSELPDQLEIKRGGLQDLFGVDPMNFE